MKRPLTLAIVAGEASGDILGAGLIRELKYLCPNAHVVGVAGRHMQKEGCETWFNMEALSVMGLAEVLIHLPRILKIRRELKHRIRALKPDIFIGIDAPDFNIPLEKYLKQQGIRTLHYVSPSIWAWRQKRVFKIAQATNCVLALLPFEKAFYDRFGISCRFVGHTLADKIPLYPDKLAARKKLGLPENALCLSLLPGSRKAEIAQLVAPFLKTAQSLREKFPSLHLLVPLVNDKRREEFEAIKANIAPDLPLQLLDGRATDAMIASDAALVASGTVTLECMLAKCPMVVAYRMNALTFWLAKRLVKTPHVSLPNLLAGKALVKECLQEECEPNTLAAALESLIHDNPERRALIEEFRFLHQKIRCDADKQAARAVMDVIDEQRV